jgi:hypothetical protein
MHILWVLLVHPNGQPFVRKRARKTPCSLSGTKYTNRLTGA